MTKSRRASEIITAGLRPELFSEGGQWPLTRRQLTVLLAVLVFASFAFRATRLGDEGLAEDELNKLQAVEDYRAHGLTSANGEHPFLMKALQTLSVVVAKRWNGITEERPAWQVSTETALRLPSAVFGSLVLVVLYLVAAELFGTEVGLIAAALWAFDPSAIAFSRIAKEDVFFLFFFLLGNVFWLKGQRIAEGGSGRDPQPYYWATAAAFGAMLASKYIPYFLAISVSYNYIFQEIPETRWRIGKKRWLIFLAVMGIVFLLCNPTILLPETWHEMFSFASYQRMGHDSYEFMNTLYTHRLADWLYGIPWYFYLVFVGVKTALPVLAAFILGLPLLLRRRLGDGRFFLFFWTLFGFIPFCLIGGKFTRYITTSLPLVFIIAAIGIQFVSRRVASLLGGQTAGRPIRSYAQAALALLVVSSSIWASASAAPHYRLYTNALGGGRALAGDYFPQDDFYDAEVRPAMFEIARAAAQGARVFSETPGLAEYYARQAGRDDLQCVSLSDRAALAKLSPGDFVIAARGRRYFSNQEFLTKLQQAGTTAFQVYVGEVAAANVYVLDQTFVPPSQE